MNHDKVRQDFEAAKDKYQCRRLKYDQNYAKAGDYYLEQTRTEFTGYCNGYQAGRAAERAEIREKLESVSEYSIAKGVAVISLGYQRAKSEDMAGTTWTRSVSRIGNELLVDITREYPEGAGFKQPESFRFAIPCGDITKILEVI